MKKLYTTICLLILAVCANAQRPSVKWQNALNLDTGIVTFDGGYIDNVIPPDSWIKDILPIKTGGYFGLIDAGGSWLVKFDSKGDTIFSKRISETINAGTNNRPVSTYYTHLAATKDGGVVVLGNMTGNKVSNPGPYGMVLSKFTADGAKVWREVYKGGKYISVTYEKEEPSDVIATPDGGFLILSYSNYLKGNDKSEDPIGSVSAAMATDFWIIKTDAEGLPEWDKTIGGSGTEYAPRAITTTDGIIIAGASNSPVSGQKTEAQKGGGENIQYNTDMWLVKIDFSGNIIWDKTIGTSDMQEYNAVIHPASDGGFYLACGTESGIDGDKSEASYGQWDAWILKCNASGKILWQKSLGGGYQDIPSSILELPDGGVLVALNSSSEKDGNKTEANFGYQNIWLVKLSSSGAILWQSVMGGTGMDRDALLTLNEDKTILLSCTSNSEKGGNRTVDAKGKFTFQGTEYKGGYDVWMILFDAETSLPVNLVSFTGNVKNTNVHLEWKVTNEVNFSRYELEKSNDGFSFNKITAVPANGSPLYSFNDKWSNETLYYRLKMVDKNGDFSYSKIVTINASIATGTFIAPNPVAGNQQLTLNIPAASKDAQWQIAGIDGKIYATQKVAAGATQVQIDTKSIANGTYILIYNSGTEKKAMRFIKN